jgi:hypothetical protein
MAKKQQASQFVGMTGDELSEAIAPHWQHLTKMLPRLDEPEVYKLLMWEIANRRNPAIAVRIHQRWSRLKAKRERETMLRDWVLP